MAVADDLERAARRADDDPRRSRSTPRRRPRRSTATSPRPSCTTSAATSPCPTTTARSRSAARSSNPLTLTLDDLRAHAGRSSAPSRSNAPATGGSRCGRCRPASPGATTPSPPHAGRARCCTRCSSGRSRSTTGVEVRFAGADHGSYILNPVLADIDASDLSFERSLPLVHAADPAAEILIAYEMNGEPLSPDHGRRSG